MDDALQRQFLDHSIEKLRQYTGRIETCLGMLNEEQVWARGGENDNAPGNLVLHLCGNGVGEIAPFDETQDRLHERRFTPQGATTWI